MEIERQISEAPDICVIVRCNPMHGLVWVEKFTNEDGETIADMGDEVYAALYRKYYHEIQDALKDGRDEMNAIINYE